MNNNIAKESEKTKRAREKLKKRLEGIDKQVTKDALKEKNREIHLWISRHARYQIKFDKKKNIFPLGKNEKIDKLCKYVESFFKRIKKNK